MGCDAVSIAVTASGTARCGSWSTAGSWWWAGRTTAAEQSLQEATAARWFAAGSWRRAAHGSRCTANRCRSIVCCYRRTAYRSWWWAAYRSRSTAGSGCSAKQTCFCRLWNSSNSHGQDGQQAQNTFHQDSPKSACSKSVSTKKLSLHALF